MKNENKRPRVAVATGNNREEAVGDALELVRDDILAKVKGRVIVKPNFLSSVNALCSTQVGAVRPILELLRDADTDSVSIAEGGSRSTVQALDNFGYRELADDFDIDFVDLNHGEFSRSFEIVTADGKTQTAQYSDFAAGADTIISVPVAKTHDTAMLTLSIKNLMGCLRRVHRPRLHGIKIGPGISRAAEWLWNAVEGHPFVLKSFSGAVFTIVNHMRSGSSGNHAFTNKGLLGQVAALAENVCRMGEVLLPDIAVIDAYEAMEGDGPGSAGSAVDMRVAVAGTDPVACDAVMASMMGFDPMSVGHLCLAHERGLGIADINEIECVGDDPKKLNRSFKKHRHYQTQIKWREARSDWR